MVDPNRGESAGRGGNTSGLPRSPAGLPIPVPGLRRVERGAQNVPQLRGQNIPEHVVRNIPQQSGQGQIRNPPQQGQGALTTQRNTGVGSQQVIPVHYGSGTNWLTTDPYAVRQGVAHPPISPQPMLGNLTRRPPGVRNPAQSPRTRYAGERPSEARNPQRLSTGFRDGMLIRGSRLPGLRGHVMDAQHQGTRNSLVSMARPSAELGMQYNYAHFNYSTGTGLPGRRPQPNPFPLPQPPQQHFPQLSDYEQQLGQLALSQSRPTNLPAEYQLPLPLDFLAPPRLSDIELELVHRQNLPAAVPQHANSQLNRSPFGSRDPLWGSVSSYRSISQQQLQHGTYNVAATTSSTTQPVGPDRSNPQIASRQQFSNLALQAPKPLGTQPAKGVLQFKEAEPPKPQPVVQECVEISSSSDEENAAVSGKRTVPEQNQTQIDGLTLNSEVKNEVDAASSDDSSSSGGDFDPAGFLSTLTDPDEETAVTAEGTSTVTVAQYVMAETPESLSLLGREVVDEPLNKLQRSPDSDEESPSSVVIGVRVAEITWKESPETNIPSAITISSQVDAGSTATIRDTADSGVEQGHAAFEVENDNSADETRGNETVYIKLGVSKGGIGNDEGGGSEKAREVKLREAMANTEEEMQGIVEEGGVNYEERKAVTTDIGEFVEDVASSVGEFVEDVASSVGEFVEDVTPGIEISEVTHNSAEQLHSVHDVSGRDEDPEEEMQTQDVEKRLHEGVSSSYNNDEDMDTQSIEDGDGGEEFYKTNKTTYYSEEEGHEAGGGENEADGILDLEKGTQEDVPVAGGETVAEEHTLAHHVSLQDHKAFTISEETENVHSSEEIENAFSAIAGRDSGRGYVNRDELRGNLTKETGYPIPGALDYVDFKEGLQPSASSKTVAEDDTLDLVKDKGLQERVVSKKGLQRETTTLRPVRPFSPDITSLTMDSVKIEVDLDAELADPGMLNAAAVNENEDEEVKFHLGDVKSESEMSAESEQARDQDEDNASVRSELSLISLKSGSDFSDSSSTSSMELYNPVNGNELFVQNFLENGDEAGHAMVQACLQKYYEVERLSKMRMQRMISQLMIIGAPQQTNMVQLHLSAMMGVTVTDIMVKSLDEFKANPSHPNYVIYVKDCEADFDNFKTLEDFLLLSSVIPKGHVDVLMWRCSKLAAPNYPSVSTMADLVRKTGLFTRPLYYDQSRSMGRTMEYCYNRFKNMDVLHPVEQ